MEKYIVIKNMRNKIDEIIDNFDFERCLIAMNALGWKYHDIPELSVTILRQKAREGLLRCISNLDTPSFYHSSCGFDSERIDDDLSLRFVIEKGESW